MDLTGKSLWQVGAGDTDRSYGDICIGYDVMIAGPGEPGAYEESLYAHLGDIRNSLRRFCREARRGDIVLLRLGTGDVLAVGEVADDAAEWLDAFADVDGWDLQHVRRVRWFPNTKNTFPPRTLGGQVRTFAAVNVEAVRAWVERLEVTEADRTRELVPLPSAGVSLDPAELGRRLFIEGLPSEHVDKLMATFSSLQRVASWYGNETKGPRADRQSRKRFATSLSRSCCRSAGRSKPPQSSGTMSMSRSSTACHQLIRLWHAWSRRSSLVDPCFPLLVKLVSMRFARVARGVTGSS